MIRQKAVPEGRQKRKSKNKSVVFNIFRIEKSRIKKFNDFNIEASAQVIECVNSTRFTVAKNDIGNGISRNGAFAGKLVRRQMFFGEQLIESVRNSFGKFHRIFTPL